MCIFRAFNKAFNDVVLSRRAIRNMNTLYPDATPEELSAADNVCIICREEMVTGKYNHQYYYLHFPYFNLT
jgi:E3 ubiquitin-protein ligase synoviolin